MGLLKHTDADVRIGGTSIKDLVSDFTLDEGPETEDITGFGDANRERTNVILDWSMRFSTRIDWTNTGLTALRDAAEAGTSVTVAFYEDATNYRSGTAFPGKSQSASVGAVQVIDWTLEANGALTRSP